MALGRFLQEASLGLAEPFSPTFRCFFYCSGNLFLLHKNCLGYYYSIYRL